MLIILVNLCVFTNHIMSLSTFPFYIQSLGGTEAQAGMCAAFFCLVAVVVRPFVGWWLDNGARRAVLVAGLVLLALAPVGYVCVPVLSMAILFRMVHGAALSLSNSTTATVASDVIARPRFAEGMGYFGMATALASAIAPALGLELMGFGFNVLYLAAAAISVLALVLFCFIRTPKPQVEKRPLSLKGLVNRDSLPATCTMLVFMFTFGALENFVAIYAANEGLPSGSLYFVVMSVVLLLVRVFLGKLVDERGEAFFVYTGNAAMICALLLWPLCPTWRPSWSLARWPDTPLAAWSRPCNPWPSTPPPTRRAVRPTPPSCADMTSAMAWAAASLACLLPRWATATCGRWCLWPAWRALRSTSCGLATARRASPRRWRRLAGVRHSAIWQIRP